MIGSTDDRLVVCIDLRHELDKVMGSPTLDERFRYAMREAHVRSADVSRVLVIDTVAELPTHHAAYERLCSDPLVSNLLCLAVGPLPGPDERVLSLPAQLRPPVAATLWIGDVRGIGWRPGQARSLALTDTDIAADDSTGLEPLIDLLRVAEVFDEAVAALSELPSAVASPSLRLLVHEVAEQDLMRAQLQALDACVSPPDDLRAGRAPGGALDVLAGYVQAEDLSVEDCLPESSLLRQAHWRSIGRLSEANDRLDALAGWRGLLMVGEPAGDVVQAAREASHALADYRDAIEQTFEWADGRAGLNADGRDHLAQMGIQLPLVPGTRPEEVGGELRRQVVQQLRRRRPLPEIVSWLRDFAARTVPTGSAAQLDRLHRICPDDLLDTLREPPPPSIGTDPVPPALWAAAAALLAGLSPVGVWGVLVVLVLLGAGAARTAGSPGRVPPATAGALAVSWLVGGAAGLGLRSVGMPVWTGTPLLVLALLAAALSARSLWVAAVRQWRSDTGLAEAGEAVERLGEVLDQGVLQHWLLADARAGASDQAKALAHLVQSVCDTLAEFAEQLSRRARPAWDSPPRDDGRTGPAGGRGGSTFAVEYVGQAGQALKTTLAGDVADLVAEVLAPYWEVVLRDPSSAAALPVASRTDGLMHEYMQQLGKMGTTPPPPFASASAGRPDPATLVGVDLRRIVDVLLPDSRNDALQLCSPDQLRMLDRAPGSARSFGFVPHAMQGAFWKAAVGSAGSEKGPDDQGNGADDAPRNNRWAAHGSPDVVGMPEIVWTASGRFAGLLRLVPLSAGAVRSVWPDADVDDASSDDSSSASRAPGETG
ncbi:hypothetical protein BN159_2055 [Streptomyces davaonensis JCM 4913]|uniref:Uncharacterized protein n=1 Tax=Streptomyces davaonensis (strain DSM 101723 / JCM 4913 / KCC S-0913 / 768) TaxID=1214101 RepID=K4R196_STRDJ|nr:hypothetical protein [Streptomyces davaonensis]CCK26434.1 hypothetical protein BN159_2055 [Streptomyces davaonensis JCM 4913]